MVENMGVNGDGTQHNEPHFQILFFSAEERLSFFPETVFNVPSSSDANQLNNLLNKVAEGIEDNWRQTSFDFLIDRILLRNSLLQFVEHHGLSGESVIRMECVLREPAPKPDHSFSDVDWVSGLKTTTSTIFSVNYGGDLSIWNIDGGKLSSKKISTEALRCIDLLKLDSEQHIVVGGQEQSLTLIRLTKSNKKQSYDAVPIASLRGHQRSVECVAAKSDGTRIVSGSFDNFLKVWDPSKNDEDNNFTQVGNEKKSKKSKIDLQIKVPMVTLESHRGAVVDVKWNPLNESQVITVSWDHSMLLWDLEMAGTLSTMNSSKAFTSLSVNSRNGCVISGSTDPNIRLWDLRSHEGSMVKELYVGHQNWVTGLSWSPDNEHLFTSCSYDNSVRMWDSRSSKAPLYDLIGHSDRVLAVDWSNKMVIASGGADSTIKTFRRTPRA